MIRIGITQRALSYTEFGERRDALDRRWHQFLLACGIVACPLPSTPDTAIITATALDLRGLVLSGGENLAVYGGEQTGRDETERRLLTWALDRQVPVIGVCRGMQLILDTFGSRLIEVEDHVGCRHEIVTPNGPRSVNSFHRWAATEVLAPLITTATAGPVVEAIRHTDASVFGLMWHPEREEPFDPLDIMFFSTVLGSAS
jgi:putative glutamine amidotransferase